MSGKKLSRHSSMEYYGQAKHWLLDQFPQQRALIEPRLLKMGRTLENFCVKRDGGGIVKKAIACKKGHLKQMMAHMYKTARTGSDYQDAALLNLLWFLFGRASDLSAVRKQNITIDAGGVFFLRLIRMKTSEEQGLSLFPDNDWITCPLLAIALALMAHVVPSCDLIGNLPAQAKTTPATLGPEASLLDLLDSPVLQLTGIDEQLTSHSFRRGGAQHANASEHLTARWIFDRGAWNVSATNKAFNYVFNTLQEDHKVSQTLSGWSPTKAIELLNVTALDAQTQDQITAVQARVFSTCHDPGKPMFNVTKSVLGVLMAYLFVHYPALKELSPDAPAVKRLEACVVDAGFSIVDLFAWSTHLANVKAAAEACSVEDDVQPTSQGRGEDERKLIQHQAIVIDHLIENARRQNNRMDALEARLNSTSNTRELQPMSTEEPQLKSTIDDLPPV
ncbi:hypothetical protein AaE_014487 [Aphanomyces astaci]|uniref:Uncharacterized protein n=1 Tax=Aphanomyces astaci TaxID=112090 RepID=A0A6A4Z674_APHAT|nr:hypothetical protein AaE_014487 [Aphanomyces astaci]